MATPGKNGKKGSQKEAPSKSAEKYFGSEVDLKLQINPPQKLTDDEKLPQPPQLPDKRKPSKDATQEDSLKELTAKLQGLGGKIQIDLGQKLVKN